MRPTFFSDRRYQSGLFIKRERLIRAVEEKRFHHMDMSKPMAEILVEGELSPFEHEALYKLLKKHFRLEQPSYSELLDETIGTRVNIVFHHPYERSFFTDILRDDWRGLKDLFKQIRYRRGRLGAGFTLTFVDQKIRLRVCFRLLGELGIGSALGQLAHLIRLLWR